MLDKKIIITADKVVKEVLNQLRVRIKEAFLKKLEKAAEDNKIKEAAADLAAKKLLDSLCYNPIKWND